MQFSHRQMTQNTICIIFSNSSPYATILKLKYIIARKNLQYNISIHVISQEIEGKK